MTSTWNLAPGLLARDIDPPYRCERCGEEIDRGQEVETDAGVYCEECAADILWYGTTLL